MNDKKMQKLCDLIEDSLNSAKLKYVFIDDESGDMLPLVDLLSSDHSDIRQGQEEIVNLVEQIYFDMEDWDLKFLTD